VLAQQSTAGWSSIVWRAPEHVAAVQVQAAEPVVAAQVRVLVEEARELAVAQAQLQQVVPDARPEQVRQEQVQAPVVPAAVQALHLEEYPVSLQLVITPQSSQFAAKPTLQYSVWSRSRRGPQTIYIGGR
jgi:hypothetical protein